MEGPRILAPVPTKGHLAGRVMFVGRSTRQRPPPRPSLTPLFLAALLLFGTLWFPHAGATAVSSPASRGSLARVGAASPLNITSFTASPSTIFAGEAVYINVTAQGGTPPYSYWYRGLPPNCLTANAPSLLCYPSDSEHYLLEGMVNDSVGDRVNATTNLTVTSGFGPPPEIQSFTASPSPGAVGKITFFVVDAVSESATPTSLLGYAFLGLPSGCATFNQTNLTCIPNEPGKYQVWVRVTDGFAQFSQTYLFFNVTGTAMTNPSGGTGVSTTTLEIVVGGAVALVVVIVAATYLLYWRKPGPPTHPTSESHEPGPSKAR